MLEIIPAAGHASESHSLPGLSLLGLQKTYSLEVMGVVVAAVIVQALLITALLLHRHRHRRAEAALSASEERYREVVETQAEMICRYTPDTTLTFVNEAYCRYFGKTREELLGKPFLTLIPEDARTAVIEATRKLVESKGRISTEHEVLRADGSICWMQWEDYAILDEQSRLEELHGIGRDVTQRRLAEEALRQSEEKFASAFRASPSAISIHRAEDGGIIDVNQSWEEFFQIERNAAVDHTPLQLGISAPEEFSRFTEAIAGRNSLRHFEVLVRTSRREARWVSLSCELIRLAGQPCYISIMHDLTERKQIEEARQSLAKSTRLAMVGELTASIAHEINQPLGAILSNAEAGEMLLEMIPPPLEEVRQILADIRRDDLRASEIIQNIRALLRNRETRPLPVDLNEIVAEVSRLVSMEAQRRRMTVIRNLAPNLPRVLGDRVQIVQVLLNLIVNGMDAMEETPQGQRRITVQTANGSRWVECVVSDEGHGFPPDQLPCIFESFFTTKANGMGLGLALARSIVEAHRGRITAENNPGRGATFRLYLPTEERGQPIDAARSREEMTYSEELR